MSSINCQEAINSNSKVTIAMEFKTWIWWVASCLLLIMEMECIVANTHLIQEMDQSLPTIILEEWLRTMLIQAIWQSATWADQIVVSIFISRSHHQPSTLTMISFLPLQTEAQWEQGTSWCLIIRVVLHPNTKWARITRKNSCESEGINQHCLRRTLTWNRVHPLCARTCWEHNSYKNTKTNKREVNVM